MMQSIFRLPWASDPVAPKLADSLAIECIRPTPVVEIPVLSKLKRKRTNSASDSSTPHNHRDKKVRPADFATASKPSLATTSPAKPATQQFATPNIGTAQFTMEAGPIHSSTKPAPRSKDLQTGSAPMLRLDTFQAVAAMEKPQLSSEPEPDLVRGDLSKVQDVIENEFNIQILMKHNELRLIEQELAKCQVALEQLRRVELRPFPGSDQPSAAVSSGIGPAVEPLAGHSRPSHPAPHGVSDGPYTLHYAQWLLHDPLFESASALSQLDGDFSNPLAGRSTRNSGSARKSISKPFVFPPRSAESLQSIPNYPSAPARDKAAPLVLKRSTDNQLVKLICNNCLRGNFSSIQGFLNHCRIAHKVDYKSHDAAAIDCGRLLDEQEAASLPLEPVATAPLHKPSVSRVSTTAPTTQRALVHPLNTAAGVSTPTSAASARTATPRAAVPSLLPGGLPISDTSLTASSQVPRLSAHFARHKLGGDLAAAVAGAKQRVEIHVDEDLMSPEGSEHGQPFDSALGARSVGGASRTIPGARPSSRKGMRTNQRQPKPSPLTPAQLHGDMKYEQREDLESPPYPPSSAATFSPHTADSNPGLVSDHEDDDHGSASEEEAPHTEMPRPFNVAGRTCADNVDIELAGDDDAHIDNGVFIRRHGLYTDETGLHGTASPSRKLGLGKRGM